ncbi:hypothetical protein ANCDUO_18728 [Ancylostoma duodenale]|uniref:Protein kinase domain-containing protein n=1 Tax=Ancylostoma duodenale TaxID=51022 RepID=A0A0C2C4G5_9BILA|nr:hypothetical protein ANCDUO_18728 [Ancylostoma duodenale]
MQQIDKELFLLSTDVSGSAYSDCEVEDVGGIVDWMTEEKDLRYMREKAAFRGTTRYASIGALEMKDQCRKDDVEAWWYMVLEWMIGQLPWKHCRVSSLISLLEFDKSKN